MTTPSVDAMLTASGKSKPDLDEMIRGGLSESEAEAARRLRIALDWMGAHTDDRELNQLGFRMPQPGTILYGDDEATDPHRLSNVISAQTMAAADLMHGIRHMMEQADGKLFIPVVSLFPLIRGLIERAAVSMWLLQPEDTRERRVRLLQHLRTEQKYLSGLANSFEPLAALREGKNLASLQDFATKAEEQNEKFGEQLEQIARRSGIALDEYKAGQGHWDAMMREIAPHSKRFAAVPVIESTWRQVTGVTHPSFLQAIGVQVHDVVERHPGDVVSSYSHVNVARLLEPIWVALTLEDEAEQLFYLRLLQLPSRV